jgi:hypothetical protein
VTKLARMLDELAADARLDGASWGDVLAREERLGQRRRRRARVALAAAVAAVLALGGTGVAVGPDLLRQQERFHASAPNDPRRVGPMVEIASGESWAVIAWKTDDGSVCLDYAVPGASPFRCGFRVPGAMDPKDPSLGDLPFQVVDGSPMGGPGLVGSDGMTAIVGVAVPEVAALEVELADGRVVGAPLYDAPRELGLDLRFFVVRVRLPADLSGERTSPVRPLGGVNPLRAFRAYDADGRLIERVVSE